MARTSYAGRAYGREEEREARELFIRAEAFPSCARAGEMGARANMEIAMERFDLLYSIVTNADGNVIGAGCWFEREGGVPRGIFVVTDPAVHSADLYAQLLAVMPDEIDAGLISPTQETIDLVNARYPGAVWTPNPAAPDQMLVEARQ